MNQRRLQFIHRPCRLAETRDKISLPLHGACPWPVWVWEASVSFVRDPTAARNCRAAERVSDHESVAVRPSVRARARSAPTPRTAQRILGTRRATPSQATPRLWTDAWLFAHTSPPPLRPSGQAYASDAAAEAPPPPHPTWRARPPRGNPARPLLLPRHPVAGRHVRPSAWLSSRVPESEDPEPTSLSGCPCLTWRAQGRDSAAAARHVAPHRRLLIILAARLIGGFVC
jgi:hypothetical protein